MEQYIPYSELPYRNKLILNIWDCWKDFYGFRPRHIDFDSMQEDELEELYKKVAFNANWSN